MLIVIMLSVAILCVATKCHYSECHYEWIYVHAFMLNDVTVIAIVHIIFGLGVVLLHVSMITVVILSVIIIIVMAPIPCPEKANLRKLRSM
jgi:hypothetical protein